MNTGTGKKYRISLMLLFLTICVFLCMPVSAAGRKVVLSRTRVTISSGGKTTIRVKGTNRKVSWSVSGKKLVTVRAKGTKKQTAVITAKKNKSGVCYVTAKAGKKKLRCRVTVKGKDTQPSVTPAPQPAVTVKDPDLIAAAKTAVTLFKKTAAEDKTGGNLLISPHSIMTALALAEQGAAGRTLSEMESALSGLSASGLSSFLSRLEGQVTSSPAVTYQIANSVWYKKGVLQIKDAFLNTVAKEFGAEVHAEPFDESTVGKINSWVSEKTQGKIRQIIDRLEPSTLAVLANAIYFKGNWAEPYADTVKRTFTDASGVKKTVSMLEGTESDYVTVSGAEGFVKYYSGGSLAFLGLLPPASQSVDAFVQSLDGESLVNAYANRTQQGVRVHTRMPEFTYEYEVTLNDILSKMGMVSAFTDAADFSRMADTPTKIDAVLHKTYIKLDKKGTEAAAVTAVVSKASCMPPSPIIEKWVYLDRPFVYAIVDTNSGMPLFLGVVEEVK